MNEVASMNVDRNISIGWDENLPPSKSVPPLQCPKQLLHSHSQKILGSLYRLFRGRSRIQKLPRPKATRPQPRRYANWPRLPTPLLTRMILFPQSRPQDPPVLNLLL